MGALPSSSRAAVLYGFDEPLVLQDVPVPNPLEPGSLLVKVEASTLCGSDVHLWDGTLGGSHPIQLPVIPGHEIVGSIVAFGAGAERDSFGAALALGDRICFTHASCDQCEACRLYNQPTLCKDRQYYMYSTCAEPPYLLGGFADYCYVLPKAGRVRVPDEVRTEWASAASCALRTVVHAFDRVGRIDPWQTVVVQGAGPLGLFATAVADHVGAGRVITIGAPAERLEIARAFGSTDLISVEEVGDPDDRVAAVRELLGGDGADVVFEFSGAPTAFPEGVAMVKAGGRYMVTGQIDGPDNEVTVRPGYITRQQLTVMGTWSGHTAEYYKALQFVRETSDKYDFSALTPRRYSLDDATEALTRMRSRKDIKPLIAPHGP